nr:hypothetical protein [Micromonospora sp. DSM 115978]
MSTVIRPPGWLRALAWLGLPVLGGAVGWLLIASTGWLLDLPWIPLRGPIRLIDSLPDPQAAIGATAIGGVLGLLGGWSVAQGGLRVTVAADRVTLRRGDTVQDFDRASVGAVFLDGGRLVLLDREGRELAREPGGLIVDVLAEPLRRHGYPWRPDGDPYRAAYRRWVPDLPGLPAGAEALLRARHRALERDQHDDADDLRSELARLDIVVRDEGKRQYWRRSGPSHQP